MQTLNGTWKLAIDPNNVGREARWFASMPGEALDAPVPGIIQQVFPAYHGVAWYWQTFRLEADGGATGGGPAGGWVGDRIQLRFGAVDYLAEVWLNGRWAGSHEGGETPFEFDVTDLLATGDNLLAVRVLNPTNEPIDGYLLKETPHRNKTIPPRPGSSFNSGGIIYPVDVRRVPRVYLADVVARPDLKTGAITTTLTVRNAGETPVAGWIGLRVAAAAGGDALHSVRVTGQFPAGESEHTLALTVAGPRPWNLDDPFLYRITATVSTELGGEHELSVRCGFRDFRIIDGYFHLNGRRLFLKSTHTGNGMPIGQQAPVLPELGRRDLIYAKAAGFNAVRFIAGVAYPEQLDFCDEIGLLVWESTYAGWCLADSPRMGERFDRSTAAMILRDRSHPSVAIWELLNETQDGPVFRHAVGFLPKLRALDPTRLVLLSSGRWDGDWTIGSASNPGSAAWEPVWGVEGPAAPLPTKVEPLRNLGYVENAGDAHYYPRAPQTREANEAIRAFGRGAKPVLLSEYGMGSLFDVIREWRRFEQIGARPDLEDAAALRLQSELLAADWQRLGFDGVYPFPEDLLRESQRLHARQRTLGFNLIRSNPQLCGYNLTGMLDHGMTGEGLWTFWREWKPATFDAVADGWAPLRWCLFVDPPHGYAGRAVTVEAVLASEDALRPGEYPARLRILGPHGVAWEQTVTVSVPDPAPLAIPVLRATVRLDGPPGEYTLAATLERGGAPTGGRLIFRITDPGALPALRGEALLWGIDIRAEAWLAAHGLRCLPMIPDAGRDCAGGDLILVGNPAGPAEDPAGWAELTSRLAAGAIVIFLSAEPFRGNEAAMHWLPLRDKGRCYKFNDWLYHKECVAQRHPIFGGLQAPGIMDWDYYGPVIPHDVFEGLDTPDETIAAAFATGHHTSPTGYACGLLIASYRAGAGRLILSTPHILENLGDHPAADRLLLNLVNEGLAKR
jgi:hypothetical protein